MLWSYDTQYEGWKQNYNDTPIFWTACAGLLFESTRISSMGYKQSLKTLKVERRVTIFTLFSTTMSHSIRWRTLSKRGRRMYVYCPSLSTAILPICSHGLPWNLTPMVLCPVVETCCKGMVNNGTVYLSNILLAGTSNHQISNPFLGCCSR